jgi:Arm DNA-binding domain
MGSARLTALRVQRLDKPGRHADGNGLYLAINDNGAKSWLFMWKKNGKRKAKGLGSLDVVSLAQARILANDERKVLHDGGDPSSSKTIKASVPTFGECADQYISDNEASWSNRKHVYQVRQQLNHFIITDYTGRPDKDRAYSEITKAYMDDQDRDGQANAPAHRSRHELC